MKDPAPLRIELKPSRIAAALIVVGVIATAVLVAWLPGERWWRASLVVALGGYGIALVRKWAYRVTRHSIVAIAVGADRRIAITERGGRRIEGVVQPDSYVGAALTTVVLRAAGARRSRAIAILPDMLPADDFRRLRVLLRLGQAPE
jgi:lysylphosphatidylglycerol synthetase-like protein (DUF2156 family)